MRDRVGRILGVTALGWLLIAPLAAHLAGRDWYGRLALAALAAAGPAALAAAAASRLEGHGAEGPVLALAVGTVLRLGGALTAGVAVTVAWPGLSPAGLAAWWACLMVLYWLALAADVWPTSGPAGTDGG